VRWSGQFRPSLHGEGVYPRPAQPKLPIWLGVGGTPQSFVRAGTLGLPLMVAIIGGDTHRFRPLVDLYREAGHRAGHAPETLQVGLHSLGYVAPAAEEAAEEFFPGYARTFSARARERGGRSITRADFDAQAGPRGALLVGDPEEVAEKIMRHGEALGGITRVTFQLDVATLPHDKVLQAIDLIGTRVAPALRPVTA
jgi:alkanesulfonate monooxygenase SsuD/methylene tetrahydromethanopterin reductase-like flavin-dependent oxidoreductase (luciferase family)